MADGVKARSYDASRRAAQTRATRAQVVAAARDLFVEAGYPNTTIGAIGEAADVPLATLYRLFGSKRGVLAAVLDVSFVGDDEPETLHERASVRTAFAETDPRALLAGFARVCREVFVRSAPMHQVLRSAATVDDDAAALLGETSRRRLEGQSRVAHELAARKALAEGMTEADAVDVIYALMAPEMYRILTVERGWSPDRYEKWLAAALASLLLP